MWINRWDGLAATDKVDWPAEAQYESTVLVLTTEWRQEGDEGGVR